MHRIFLPIMAVFIGSTALGEEWLKLDTNSIEKALTSRVLQYDNGAMQNFYQDKSTLYETPNATWGEWSAKEDKYCSIWPPAVTWMCYDVFISTDNLQIRFQKEDTLPTDGKYIDLN